MTFKNVNLNFIGGVHMESFNELFVPFFIYFFAMQEQVILIDLALK